MSDYDVVNSRHNLLDENVKQQRGGPTPAASGTIPDSITYDRFQILLQNSLDQQFQRMKIYFNQQIDAKITVAIQGLEDNFTKATDFLEDNQKEIKTNVSAATNRIKSLEVEKLALETSVIELNRRIETLEKTSRSRNIEIQAVPEKKSENVMFIIKKIYEVLNIPSPAEAETSSVRRVAKLKPDSDRPRNILLTLQSERQRDQLISAFRRYNKNNPKAELSSSSIGLPGPSQRIYLSEHLSSQCKELHYAARKFAKEHSFTYVWIKYGRVYLRKNDNEPAIHIKTKNDFDKLK
ncbi:hypothetical protein O0L34_g13995 [Tuta absoluta]|nr:hypothetical protein O0L34_g13995 [Tuta absoluta]